jgi:hypothetical protein
MLTSRLCDQQWKPVSFDEVRLAFLRAEWDRWLPSQLRWLIDEADLGNATENRVRLGLLDLCRGPLLQHVPTSTEWYVVRCLETHHLPELLVIGRCGWDDERDRNELAAVARRKPLGLKKPAAAWEALILWGHSKDGPFTILEGNNRLVAYASGSGQPPLGIPVYVGLSADHCHWHLHDPSP